VSLFSKLRNKFLNEETTNTKKKGLEKACYPSSRNMCNRLETLCIVYQHSIRVWPHIFMVSRRSYSFCGARSKQNVAQMRLLVSSCQCVLTIRDLLNGFARN